MMTGVKYRYGRNEPYRYKRIRRNAKTAHYKRTPRFIEDGLATSTI